MTYTKDDYSKMTIKEATLSYIRDVGGPAQPKAVAEATGKNADSVRTEMRKMETAGLLSRSGYGQYRLPEKVDEGGGSVNNKQEDVSGRPDHSSHKTAALEAVPVLGGDGPGTAARMMQIDSDLLRATGIDLDSTSIIPVLGSSAEPYLSHGQLALATPVDRVQGEDLYVYYSWAQEAHLVAWMDRANDTITFETGSRKNTYVPKDGDRWEGDDGETERLRIVGRVVGAVMPVGKQRAQKQELVRMLMET